MDPLSAGEIDRIKKINYKEYSDIPILYKKEIDEIFFSILPILMNIAIDHAKKHEELAKRDKMNLDRNELKFIATFLQAEDIYLSELETDMTKLRNHFQEKVQLLEMADSHKLRPMVLEDIISFEPEAVVESIEPVVPWYKRWFQKEKAQ